MAEGFEFDPMDPAGLNALDQEIAVDIEDPLQGVIPEMPQRRVRREFLAMESPIDLYDEVEFKRRFRFTKNTVRNVIFPLVEHELQTENDRGLPVPAMLKLLAVLRFYATGSFQLVTGDLLGVSQPTVSRAVAAVSTVLAGQVPRFVKFPTGQSLHQVKDDFEVLGRRGAWNGIPGVIGALDGCHVPIDRPRVENPEVFRNRKGVFSVNVMAVCGPDMTFYDVVARWPGSEHDSPIFQALSLFMRLEDGELDGMLVGDKGYRAYRFLLTPVRDITTLPEERFNIAHAKMRNVIERAFGKAKRRFPCLRKGLALKLETTLRVISACFVLHNIGIREGDDDAFDDEDQDEVEDRGGHDEVPPGGRIDPAEGLAFRRALINRLFSWYDNIAHLRKMWAGEAEWF